MKRIITALLCLCLIIALLPTVAMAEGSSSVYAIQLGFDNIKNRDIVDFGSYQENGKTYNVQWYVVNDVLPAPSGTTNYLPLLSAYTLGSTKFRSDAGYYAWDADKNASDSLLKQKMDGMYNTLFTIAERNCVAPTEMLQTELSSTNGTSETKTVSVAHLFPLSQAELNKLSAGFLKKSDMISSSGTYTNYYLRDSDGKDSVYVVGGDGNLSSIDVSVAYSAIRPAFNLDLSTVLFASRSLSRTASSDDGALTAVSTFDNTSGSTTWKLTLRDTFHSGFSAVASSGFTQTKGYSSWNVEVTYSGAITGTNQYISAMLVNSSGDVIYYGRLEQLGITSNTAGTLSIAIPTGLDAGDYTLKVFNEQYNGESKTDYSSDFVDIPLSVCGDGIALEQSVFDIFTDKIVLGGKQWWVVGNSTQGVYKQANHLTLYGATADFGWNYFRNSGSADDGKSQEYSGSYYAKNPDGMNAWTKPNEYAGSTLEQTMVSLTGSLFTELERGAITARSFNANETGQAITDKLWAMSTDEIATIYNDSGNADLRKAILGNGYGKNYFLRNAPGDAQKVYYIDPANAGRVTNAFDRMVANVNTGWDGDVRPALSLNLNNVLFASAAEGGKIANGTQLTKSVNNANDVFKLTLYDSAKSGFSATATNATTPAGYSSWNVDVSYSGAVTGENEYISAMLVSSTGDIMYYGRLKNLTTESNSAGTVSVAMPTGLAGGSYTLKVFNEQYNGDNKTDYSSKLIDISLTVNVTKYDLSVELNGGNGSTAGGSYAKGEGVGINAGTRVGYIFAGWSSSNGGAFVDSTKAATTFVMPGAATTITASWTECDHKGNTNKAPTCTEDATCSRCGKTFAKLGHDWSTDVTYSWTGVTACTAKRVCKRNGSHTDTATATITDAVTTAATCEKDGVKTYTATFAEDWAESREKTETIEKLGHSLKWESGNGMYWQQCDRNGCSYKTAAKAIPQIAISGADRVCEGKDYTFTFTVGEGLGNLSVKYGFSTSTDVTNITDDNGTRTATLSAADINAVNTQSESRLTITISAVTEDGFAVEKTKTVELVVGHDYSAANCKDPKTCTVCGDKEGNTDPANHTNLKHFAAKAATSESEGNSEYWYCDGCGRYYSNEDAVEKYEIKKESTVIAKLPPSPMTDDSTDIALWLCAFALSAAALAVTVIDKKKKANR